MSTNPSARNAATEWEKKKASITPGKKPHGIPEPSPRRRQATRHHEARARHLPPAHLHPVSSRFRVSLERYHVLRSPAFTRSAVPASAITAQSTLLRIHHPQRARNLPSFLPSFAVAMVAGRWTTIFVKGCRVDSVCKSLVKTPETQKNSVHGGMQRPPSPEHGERDCKWRGISRIVLEDVPPCHSTAIFVENCVVP